MLPSALYHRSVSYQLFSVVLPVLGPPLFRCVAVSTFVLGMFGQFRRHGFWYYVCLNSPNVRGLSPGFSCRLRHIASCLPLDINGPLVIHVRPNVGDRPDDQDDLSYLFDV